MYQTKEFKDKLMRYLSWLENTTTWKFTLNIENDNNSSYSSLDTPLSAHAEDMYCS